MTGFLSVPIANKTPRILLGPKGLLVQYLYKFSLVYSNGSAHLTSATIRDSLLHFTN